MTTARALSAPMTSAADALRAEEVTRTRGVLRIGWIIALGVIVAVLVTPGDHRIATALLATLGLGLAHSVWMHAQLARPQGYTPERMNVLAITAVACGQLGTLYVGSLSAAPIMVALGLYFFCRTESRTSAIAIYALAVSAHLTEATLILSGAIDDPGFYPVASGASLQVQITGYGLVQFAYGLCFWLARVTRRTSLRSSDLPVWAEPEGLAPRARRVHADA